MTTTVFTWGNPSRGDDGVGPWLAGYLRSKPFADVLLVEDFQLQVEHLLDCRAAHLLLFIDARANAGPPLSFDAVKASNSRTCASHALTPAQLLGYYGTTFRGETAPPAFALTVAGHCFELGAAMSDATRSGCEQACLLLDRLLRRPDPRLWRQLSLEYGLQGDAGLTA